MSERAGGSPICNGIEDEARAEADRAASGRKRQAMASSSFDAIALPFDGNDARAAEELNVWARQHPIQHVDGGLRLETER